MQYIASIAAHRASKFTKSGIMDDIVTDVTGDILIAAKDGTLAVALAKAKEAETPAEVLHNVKGVVMQATKFRVSDAVRWTYRTKAVQFSQIKQGDRRIASVQANDESALEQYKSLIVNELGLMAQAAEHRPQRSRRGSTRRQEVALARACVWRLPLCLTGLTVGPCRSCRRSTG